MSVTYQCIHLTLWILVGPTVVHTMTPFGPFGPPYPVTAAWFQDRYSAEEWNRTLAQFALVGGDTVLLRAPSVVVMTEQDMRSDPEFQWCRATDGSQRPCYDEIVSDLSSLGVKVQAFAKFPYQEDYDEASMLQCPGYDTKIVSSRVYFRLVLSLEPVDTGSPCNLTGKSVMVLITSFAGVDPHALALQTAHDFNMSVYFGLPQPMVDYSNNEIFPVPLYFNFISRLLKSHKAKFSNGAHTELFSNLKGYVFSYEFPLIAINHDKKVLDTITKIGHAVHSFEKQLLVMTFISGMKIMETDVSLKDHMTAFEMLVQSKAVDVISVKDGRGSGYGAYFWTTQDGASIQNSDHGLYQILKTMYPNVQPNVTFGEVYWTSVQQVGNVSTLDSSYFTAVGKMTPYAHSLDLEETPSNTASHPDQAVCHPRCIYINYNYHLKHLKHTFYYLAQTRDKLAAQGSAVDLWLSIEAYDNLHDDPCLPVDVSGSGVDRMLNRVTKSRLDRALSNAGAYVQRVAALAWDPGFTCTTRGHTAPLWGQVNADMGRPIIANCSFHNSFNRSVVVIGYNLDGLTQGFTVNWPSVDGHRVTSTDVHGYYFELDWGVAHHRVPSLMYTQLYDPYDVIKLAPRGYVKVSAEGASHGCQFTYDFTTKAPRPRRERVKKHYAFLEKPKTRVYGQDTPFF